MKSKKQNLSFLVKVAHFSILEKLVLAITSRILRILMKYIEIKYSLDSKLQTLSVCSVRVLNIFEVIAKTSFFTNSKMLNPGSYRKNADWMQSKMNPIMMKTTNLTLPKTMPTYWICPFLVWHWNRSKNCSKKKVRTLSC